MQARLWIRYLCGQGSAIREVAESRSALWTGIGLVLLTSIARNYDQTFIGEKIFLWLFGSLLFSMVSGTWLYIIVYGWFVRRGAADADGNKPAFWSGWRGFMGLFWMTAPIAWLYAIPVERFYDSIIAAKLNLCLLAIVSFWRVALMARVFQVMAKAPFMMILVWVLLAAAVEVCVVVFFGGSFAKRIMAGMGGMRNSPEEEILYSAMSAVFTVAFWAVPVALVTALLWRPFGRLTPLPGLQSRPIAWGSLTMLVLFWVVVAIVPQRELVNSVAVERMVASGQARAALDYLGRHERTDFAPARTLPPKAHESELFEQLPACFDEVQSADPTWVRRHLVGRLDEMMVHYGPRWKRKTRLASLPPEEQIQHIVDGVKWLGPDAEGLLKLVNGLERIPEGQAWLATNKTFLQALQQTVNDPDGQKSSNAKPEPEQLSNWLSLSNRLRDLLPGDWPNPIASPPQTPKPVQP